MVKGSFVSSARSEARMNLKRRAHAFFDGVDEWRTPPARKREVAEHGRTALRTLRKILPPIVVRQDFSGHSVKHSRRGRIASPKGSHSEPLLGGGQAPREGPCACDILASSAWPAFHAK